MPIPLPEARWQDLSQASARTSRPTKRRKETRCGATRQTSQKDWFWTIPSKPVLFSRWTGLSQPSFLSKTGCFFWAVDGFLTGPPERTVGSCPFAAPGSPFAPAEPPARRTRCRSAALLGRRAAPKGFAPQSGGRSVLMCFLLTNAAAITVDAQDLQICGKAFVVHLLFKKDTFLLHEGTSASTHGL